MPPVIRLPRASLSGDDDPPQLAGFVGCTVAGEAPRAPDTNASVGSACPTASPEEQLRRGGGRPRGSRLPEPRAMVGTWLEASLHDKLLKHAAGHEESVSRTVRHFVILGLSTRPPTT